MSDHLNYNGSMLAPVIVRFYSERTQAEEHDLLAELADGAIVYRHVSGQFVTTGAQGHRTSDSTDGLIIHEMVTAAMQGGAEAVRPISQAQSSISHWRGAQSPLATLLAVLENAQPD